MLSWSLTLGDISGSVPEIDDMTDTILSKQNKTNQKKKSKNLKQNQMDISINE